MITLDEQSQVQKWLEDEKNGIQFPVDFELAWSMAGYAYKQDASNNVKNNLEKGIDFLGKSLKNGQRGRSGVSFELTCDGFKHFCLMAKTEKGRAIRKYFIEAEKALNNAIPLCQALAKENESLKSQPEVSTTTKWMVERYLELGKLASDLLDENEALKAGNANLSAITPYLDMVNRSVNTTHALILQTKAIAENIKAYA
jgi:phage anti-repressor protein